jgi:thiamine pyrophosphate-dependent acetolactate synthase large subunit-like protein
MSKKNKLRFARTGAKSRRTFMQEAVLSAGATAAVLGTGKAVLAAVQDNGSKPITIPPEFDVANTTTLPTIDFPMTGAQVFAKACKDEQVGALFCCPGNYPVVNAIAESGIPTYSGRHEGSLCHAADAFCRATGQIAATSGTEGPGFTNMICAIAAASAARSPILVLASNKSVFSEDTERGIQEGYQQPTTEGIRKYGKRLITPARTWEYAGYAFRQLKSGVPGPVHLDFPSEIASARFSDASEVEYYHDKTKYRTDTKPYPDPMAIADAVKMLQVADRPIVVSSNGVFYGKAWDALLKFAEKGQIPVVESGAMKGQFPADHELSVDAAPGALASADLVLLVGQHCMPTLGEFAFGPDARYIRIDQASADIGRNLPIDIGIVSDEKAALEALTAAMPMQRHDAWISEIASARKAFEMENENYYRSGLEYTDAVHPAVIGKELADFLYHEDIPKDRTTILQGGYGIARYTRRYLRAYRPGQIINGAYQYGAIGPDVGYALGVAVAVKHGIGPQANFRGHPIVAVTGDAGFGYTGMELETLSKYRLPAVVIVYNNNAWGTWSGDRNNKVGLPIHLFQENLRYDKLGEALGAYGEYVTHPRDFKPALERAYQVARDESRPAVINVQAKKEFWLRDEYPPGFLGKIEPGVMSYYH